MTHAPLARAIIRSAFAGCCLLLLGSVGSQAGVRDDVNRAMRQFDRDLCNTFDLKGCKAASPRRQNPRAKANKSTTPPKPKEPSAARMAPAGFPIPRQKPQDLRDALKEPQKSVADSDLPAVHFPVPLPRAKPLVPAKGAAAKPADSRPRVAERSTPVEKPDQTRIATVTPVLPAPGIPSAPAASIDADCQKRLASLDVSFAPEPNLANSGKCTLTDPIRLSSIVVDGNKITFPDQPVLNCAFAESFAKWIKEKADAAARREAKSGLAVLYTGPGYQCRGRNGDGSVKLSEHGYGNAVDITQFKLKDGHTFQVADALNPVSPAYATLRSMRFSACERFSTVLGPGTNAAHAEHFHFDNGRHGKSGTYRIFE